MLRKSAFYLLFEHHYSKIIEMIVDHDIDPQEKNEYLFNNCFHRICCFTSKGETEWCQTENSSHSINIFFLFTDNPTFTIHLFGDNDSAPDIIMKQFDIIVLTDKYPITGFTTSDYVSNYVLVSFSISEKLTEYFNSESFEENYSIYQKVCKVTGPNNFMANNTNPYDRFKSIIIDQFQPYDQTVTHQDRFGFYEYNNRLVFEMKIKELRFEQMMLDEENTEAIKELEFNEENRIALEGRINATAARIRNRPLSLSFINRVNHLSHIVYLRRSEIERISAP